MPWEWPKKQQKNKKKTKTTTTKLKKKILKKKKESSVAMSCGVGHRCGSNQVLLWYRPEAAALIQPLAWEPAYAAGAAQEMAKNKNK